MKNSAILDIQKSVLRMLIRSITSKTQTEECLRLKTFASPGITLTDIQDAEKLSNFHLDTTAENRFLLLKCCSCDSYGLNS